MFTISRLVRTVAFSLFAALTVVPAVSAQESASQEPEPLPPFHVAALIGESHNGDRNGVTIGGDVEFRIGRLIGVGFTGEHVNKPFRENVWIVPLLIHPTAGLKLTAGPGFERLREEGIVEGASENTARKVVQRALWRVGVGYDLPLRHGWTLDPDVAVDFVDGEKVLVYALGIGKEFGRR
jgi:hypothetical protein